MASSFTSIIGPVQAALNQLMATFGGCLEYAMELDVADAVEMLEEGEEAMEEGLADLQSDVQGDGHARGGNLATAVGLTTGAVAAGIVADHLVDQKRRAKDGDNKTGTCFGFLLVCALCVCVCVCVCSFLLCV